MSKSVQSNISLLTRAVATKLAEEKSVYHTVYGQTFDVYVVFFMYICMHAHKRTCLLLVVIWRFPNHPFAVPNQECGIFTIAALYSYVLCV